MSELFHSIQPAEYLYPWMIAPWSHTKHQWPYFADDPRDHEQLNKLQWEWQPYGGGVIIILFVRNSKGILKQLGAPRYFDDLEIALHRIDRQIAPITSKNKPEELDQAERRQLPKDQLQPDFPG